MATTGLVRLLAGSVLVGVLGLACAPTSETPPATAPEAGTATPDPTGGPVPPGGTPTTPPGAPATDGPGPTEEPASGAEDTGETALTPVDDLGAVGANGRAILRGDRPQLVLEVDVQEGVSPDPAALDHLVAALGEHVDKPGGIVFAGGETFTSDRTEWTATDLRDVAAQHRDTASSDDAVSVYVLYVRGGFHADGEETPAIGVAYRASELALFPERWAGLVDVLGSSSRLERAVLVHELGHLLGLVELTYESERRPQDPEHPGHSSSRGSVMFWAVETTLVGQVLGGPPPDRFDADDAADLAALREGR